MTGVQPDAALPAAVDGAGLETGGRSASGEPASRTSRQFHVALDNFTGPFDLLLQLLGKNKLEITELSLSKVTDEFLSYIRAMGDDWDLDEASEFLVVAATLLDLKTAKLLPQAEVEDEEDLALLEARDLLFARLLQYKAYKELAGLIAELDEQAGRGFPRAVRLEERFAEALPELVLTIDVEKLAQLAVKALTPKPVPMVAIDHVHMVRVSVREHMLILRERLIALRTATFRQLCADCTTVLQIVARFLAVLELYREGLITFDQVAALTELTITWTGDDEAGMEFHVDEYGEGDPEVVGELVTEQDEDDLVEGENLDGIDDREAAS
ncbi:MAG TPA: segregation/condensation protein A [Micromonosporaceae bacterium]